MGVRQGQDDQQAAARGAGPELLAPQRRRAYYRVSGYLPIRLTPLAPEVVDAAVFDLSLPDPLIQPIADADEDSPLAARLRRIEEKLDLLLGASPVEVPRQLRGRDRQSIVFSGSGLAVDVTWTFRSGDAYKVEILLPPPYCRLVRAIGFAVRDAPLAVAGEGPRTLPIELRHMEVEERDALVAYSYDLQRVNLRARGGRPVGSGHGKANGECAS